MTAADVAVELKSVLGAMLFGARQPVSVAELRRVLREVAETGGDAGRAFAEVREADIVSALDRLKEDLGGLRIGLRLAEVAGGFRFQTAAECGPWLRQLLALGKPARLTRPTLETLAIIAYRQPITRAEIESVRGVAVDTIVRNLMELQLIRIVGRSPLPGRPLLLGTTPLFLEHFGLKDLKDLPGIEQLCRREQDLARPNRPPADAEGTPPPDAAPGETGAGDDPDNADEDEDDEADEDEDEDIDEADEDEDEEDDEAGDDDEDEDEDEDDGGGHAAQSPAKND